MSGRLSLDGRVFVSRMDDMSWEAITEAVGSDFILGGEWKPGHCQSHTRMAIIIPCRDRDSHLRILLKHLIPILKRQLIHFRIFVIDQVDELSNRSPIDVLITSYS